MTLMAHPAARLLCAVVVAICAEFSAAGKADTAAPMIVSPEAISDFLIQNVCLDTSRRILLGISPVDGDPRCVAKRDLALGEKLSYHKHDHPSPGDRASAARGYQRSDSFPVETASFGNVVEHSFDFGAGMG